jgi:hypothetical protein
MLAMVIGLLVAIPLFAAEAPTGMGDLKWGATMQDFNGLGSSFTSRGRELRPQPPTKTGNEYIGVRRINLGEIKSITTRYHFYENKYYRFRALDGNYVLHPEWYPKELLISKYGQPLITPLFLKINPNAKAGESCLWKIGDVEICLELNSIQGEWVLQYTYMPIYLEKEKAEKLGDKTKDAL